jgi:hypothetical protein
MYIGITLASKSFMDRKSTFYIIDIKKVKETREKELPCIQQAQRPPP